MIKDSGERTRFDTGAVRDMHTGKGRFGVNGSRMLFLNCMIALKKVMCPLKIFT
jgi:hypothetical protein